MFGSVERRTHSQAGSPGWCSPLYIWLIQIGGRRACVRRVVKAFPMVEELHFVWGTWWRRSRRAPVMSKVLDFGGFLSLGSMLPGTKLGVLWLGGRVDCDEYEPLGPCEAFAFALGARAAAAHARVVGFDVATLALTREQVSGIEFPEIVFGGWRAVGVWNFDEHGTVVRWLGGE